MTRTATLALPALALLLGLVLAPALDAQVGTLSVQPRMGDPIPGLTVLELDRFVKGGVEFEHALTTAEGLGPIFNDVSCAQCHANPAIGGFHSVDVTRFGKAASGPNPFDPLADLGGSLLQKSFIGLAECEEVVPLPEADVVIKRITPPIFGYGLVEAIPDADLLALEASPPDPAVSPIAHMVKALEDPLGPDRVGRFGWKAQVATLLSFSGDASLNEMGLTNRLVGQENAPNGDLVKLAACDGVADPEDGPDIEGFDRIDRQTDFQRFLATPPQTPRSGMTGEAIFNTIGCAHCHVAEWTSGNAPETALSYQTFRPYSDFMLHDMGALGDGIVQGAGTEFEMRTAPLWGLLSRAGTAMLHDGRATGSIGGATEDLDLALLEHDGEAALSRAAYVALSPTDQVLLYRFLLSLGRAEFDIEGNNTVDQFDWFLLEALGYFSGPGAFYTPDDEASLADIDQDGDFDLVDFGYLQRAFTGEVPAD